MNLLILTIGSGFAIFGAMLIAFGVRIWKADAGAYHAAQRMTPSLSQALRGEIVPPHNDPGANEYALTHGLSRNALTKKFISQAKLSEEFVDDILRR